MGHFFQHLEHGGLGGRHGELRGFAHDLVHAREQDAAETSAGVETREVVLLEAARLKQDHGQRVAEGEHGRRAGGRGEIERAGLLADRNIKDHIGGLAQRGIAAAGHGDQFHIEAGQRRKDVEEFGRLTAVAEGEDDVAVGDQPEVAVEGVEGIEDNGGGTRAGQGGGNFVADMAGFAHAANDDFTAVVGAVLKGLDGTAESGAVEVLRETAQFVRLDADDTAGFGQIIHGQGNDSADAAAWRE